MKIQEVTVLWLSRLVSMDLAASVVWSSAQGLNNPNIEFVGINDPFMTPDYMAYMLRYDTMHGRYEGQDRYTDDAIIVDGKRLSSSPA